MSKHSYQIDPRPLELGGGWRLKLIEDGEEVGGGVFPLSAYATEDNAYQDALAEASAWLAGCNANRKIAKNR